MQRLELESSGLRLATLFKKIKWTFSIHFLNSLLNIYCSYSIIVCSYGQVLWLCQGYTCHKLTLKSLAVPATQCFIQIECVQQ